MEQKPVELPGVRVSPIDQVEEKADLASSSGLSSASARLKKDSHETFKNPLLGKVKKTIQAGENRFRQVGRVEVKAFDSSFVDALENGLEAIGRILANPRTFIKETTEIENVEKAKKVSTVSIQHFATHSQYLRTIQENGEVIPDKILTIHSETNTAIYENRFVMTLIKRALSFTEQRYNFVRDHGETRDSDELLIHSKSNFSGVEYEVAMRVRASVPSADAGESAKNEAILRRLNGCKKRCGDYLRSSFMTQMKGAKDVTSPVHMTNMLLKHPDYHAAYELWEFIEQYDSLGVSYDVQESLGGFDEEYLSSLYEVVAQAVLQFHSRHVGVASVSGDEDKLKRVTPTIIFDMDDVNYDDGRFLYDAYPAAEAPVDPTSVILEEERKKVVSEKLNHLQGQAIAKAKVVKTIRRDKDRVAFEGAKGRDEKKAVLEAKEKEKRDLRAKEEEAARLAEEQEKAKALEALKEQERLAYEEARRKAEGGE